MKYMVEVNAKYLVTVEAESALEAEHKMLDYYGVWGALAFDRKALKTDTFADVVVSCFTASEDDIQAMSFTLRTMSAEIVRANERISEIDSEIEELERQITAAKEARAEVEQQRLICQDEYNTREETLGKQRT